MIFRERKRVKDVKKYAVPYNPKTGDQGAQRDYLKNANLAWKTDGYNELDIEAWKSYAGIQNRALSGYNIFLSERINTSREGKTWAKLTNYNIYDITGGGFKVDINVESDLDGVLYIGTSKLAMIKEFIGSFSVDKYTFTVTGLSEETKYYFYIKNTSAGEKGRTGIYSTKTVIGVPPVQITMGMGAIDRALNVTSERTYILLGKAANAAGKITKIEIYMYSNENFECKVATFFNVSANNYSTRAWVSLPVPILYGAKRTFDVDLDVEIGDLIGLWCYAGKLERDLTGGFGYRYRSGDNIPCVNKDFGILGADQALSLWGEN